MHNDNVKIIYNLCLQQVSRSIFLVILIPVIAFESLDIDGLTRTETRTKHGDIHFDITCCDVKQFRSAHLFRTSLTSRGKAQRQASTLWRCGWRGHGDIDVENVLFDGGVQMDLPDPDHPALVQSGPMFSAATLFPYHAQ